MLAPTAMRSPSMMETMKMEMAISASTPAKMVRRRHPANPRAFRKMSIAFMVYDIEL